MHVACYAYFYLSFNQIIMQMGEKYENRCI